MQTVVARALAQSIPERLQAGSAHWSNVAMFSGTDPQTGVHWGHMLLNGGGGGGSARSTDGWPLATTVAARGGLKTASVEHTELLYPLLFDEWEIETDSMGLGEHIGGPGVRCTVRPLEAPVRMVGRFDGQRNPPFGVLGGTPGCGGGHYIADAGGRRRFLPQAFDVTLQPWERWTGVSTGGGGFGNPLDRPVEQVCADVRNGLYSADLARATFGVIVSADGLVLDVDGTTAARAEIRARAEEAGVPTCLPDRPGAATWIRDQMRAEDELVPLSPGLWRP
jgi:N-methylhydantoinase B